MENQMNYLENGKMVMVYNGIEIALNQAPSAENYQERVCYDTTGRDAAGNEYYLRWDTTDRWDAANEAGIDENGAPCDAYFEDESNACDWDEPAEVRVTLHAEDVEEEYAQRNYAVNTDAE